MRHSNYVNGNVSLLPSSLYTKMLLLTEISRFRKRAWLHWYSTLNYRSFGYFSKKDFPNFPPPFIAQKYTGEMSSFYLVRRTKKWHNLRDFHKISRINSCSNVNHLFHFNIANTEVAISIRKVTGVFHSFSIKVNSGLNFLTPKCFPICWYSNAGSITPFQCKINNWWKFI